MLHTVHQIIEWFKYPKLFKVPIDDLGNHRIVIDLGCGFNKIRGSIGADIGYTPATDIIADIHNLPFRNDSCDLVIARSVLEHTDKPIYVLNQIHRILKIGGKFRAYVPHAFGRDAFDNPTHMSFYTLNTIDFFLGKVTEYIPIKKFKLGYRKLRIKINPPTNNLYMKKLYELILLPLNIPIILLGFTFPRFMEELIKLPFFIGEL